MQTAFTGHVNPDGTASEDGIGPADGNVAKMWSASTTCRKAGK